MDVAKYLLEEINSWKNLKKKIEKDRRKGSGNAKITTKDEVKRKKFFQIYSKKIDYKIKNINPKEELKLIRTHEQSLYEYFNVYLTNCIDLEENKEQIEKLKDARNAITKHVDNILENYNKEADSTKDPKIKKALEIFEELEIKDETTKEIILQKIKIFSGPLSTMRFDELAPLFIQKRAHDNNEAIERKEATDICKAEHLAIFGAELTALASVEHEAKNTKVTIWRRVLESFVLERDSENLENLCYDHNRKEDFKSTIINLNNYLKENNSKSEILKAFYKLNDARIQRKSLMRIGRKRAVFLTVVGVAIFASSVAGVILALTSPIIPVAWATAFATVPFAFEKTCKFIGARIQSFIAHKLLPKTDYKAEAFGDDIENCRIKLETHLKEDKSVKSKHDSEEEKTNELEINLKNPERTPEFKPKQNTEYLPYLTLSSDDEPSTKSKYEVSLETDDEKYSKDELEFVLNRYDELNKEVPFDQIDEELKNSFLNKFKKPLNDTTPIKFYKKELRINLNNMKESKQPRFSFI